MLGNVEGADLKKQPKHNPCRPVGRNWKDPKAGKVRHLDTVCLTKVHMIAWNPNGIPTRSMENMKWFSPSQVLTAKHVSYPQLTATVGDAVYGLHGMVATLQAMEYN